jgi:hypothetical protein
MATFTDVYKQELKSKGILSSIGTAALKRTREKLDIRNMLFGGSGAIAATGQKVFGKGYQAIQRGGSTAKVVSENIGTQSIAMDQLLLSSQKQESQLAIIAKNTMNSNAMARDMNVMRQNIMKLVTMGGGKASRGADMFFKEAAAREASYESQFKKGMEKTPTAIGSASKDKDKKSFLSTLFGGALSGIGFAITTLGKTLISALSGIKDILTDVKNLITGIKLSDLFKIGATGGIAGIVTSILGILKSPVVLTALAVILPSLYALMKAREGSKIGVPEDASRKQQLSSNQTAIMESKNVRISGVWADGKNTQKSAFDLIQEEQNLNQLVSKNPKMLDEKAKKLSAMRINALASEGFYPLGDYTPGKNKELLFRREVKEPNMLDLPNTAPNTTPQKINNNLLNMIGSAEGGSMGYDAANRGKAGDTPGGIPGLSNMTISDIMQLQKDKKLFAAGRYQIIPSTLEGLIDNKYGNIGVTKNDVFSPEIQDKMVQALIDHRLKVAGNDPVKQQLELSKEFAAIANPSTGKSFYEGKGNNRASISTEKIQSALRPSGDNLTQGSSALAAMTRDMNVAQAPNVTVNTSETKVASGKAPSAPVASATNVDALELFFKYAM